MKTVEKTRRTPWKTWLVVLLVLATVGTGAYLGFSFFDRLCTTLAIADFRLRPSEEGAQALVELVDDGSATREQIEQILPLLFTPKVTKEEAYPLGSVPAIRVELPFEIVFENLAVDVNECVWANGQCQYGTAMNGARTLCRNPHFLRLHPAPTEPGTYKMELRYTVRLRPQRRRVWQWDPARGILVPQRRFVDIPDPSSREPLHEQNIVVPVEIVVAETPGAKDSGTRQAVPSTQFPDDDIDLH